MANNTSQMKLLTKSQLIIVACLGGPIGLGYFLSRNFKALGDKRAAKITIFSTLVLTCLLFILAFCSQHPMSLYVYFIPLILGKFCWNQFQKKAVQNALMQGRKQLSALYLTIISPLFLVVTITLVELIYIPFDPTPVVEEAMTDIKHHDYNKAYPLLLTLAKKGHAFSQWLLATMYLHGNGTQKNLTLARKWLKKSAAQDFAPSEYYLSGMYFMAMGGPKDLKKHFYWLKKSAEQGYPDAEYILGLDYLSGRFGAADKQKSLYWLKKAAKNGNVNAISTIEKRF